MTTRISFLAAAGLGFALLATPALAAPTIIGQFTGNECNGQGGFNNCFAFPNGTTGQGAGDGTGSPAIFKKNSDGSIAISTKFPTINGTEFNVTYVGGGTNQLSFTYTPGAGDPVIHYFSVFQANKAFLYYDAAPITSYTIALSSLFPNNPGWSHITFYDTGSTPPPPAVPEPATWAMMICGFGAMGVALRRRPKASVSYA